MTREREEMMMFRKSRFAIRFGILLARPIAPIASSAPQEDQTMRPRKHRIRFRLFIYLFVGKFPNFIVLSLRFQFYF